VVECGQSGQENRLRDVSSPLLPARLTPWSFHRSIVGVSTSNRTRAKRALSRPSSSSSSLRAPLAFFRGFPLRSYLAHHLLGTALPSHDVSMLVDPLQQTSLVSSDCVLQSERRPQGVCRHSENDLQGPPRKAFLSRSLGPRNDEKGSKCTSSPTHQSLGFVL